MEKKIFSRKVCTVLSICMGMLGCGGINYDTFKGKDPTSNIEITVVTKTDNEASFGIDDTYRPYFVEEEFEIKLPNGEVIKLKQTDDTIRDWNYLTQAQISELKKFIPNPESLDVSQPRVEFKVSAASSYDAVTEGVVTVGNSSSDTIEGLSPIVVQRQ